MEAIEAAKLSKIANIGRLYYVGKLIDHEIKTKDFLQTDWYEAIKFFFSKTFYQGRRDSLSEKFHKNALAVLDNYLGQSTEQKKDKLVMLRDDGSLEKGKKDNVFYKKLADGGVPKSGDRWMVITALKFALSLPDCNIVNWAIEEVKKGNLHQAYNKVDDVWSVGDKTTSLFFRDLVTVFELQNAIKDKDLPLLQPIDTWVKQLAVKLNINTNENVSDKELKQLIVDECSKHKVSAIHFNQGAWYISAHSLDLLLEEFIA